MDWFAGYVGETESLWAGLHPRLQFRSGPEGGHEDEPERMRIRQLGERVVRERLIACGLTAIPTGLRPSCAEVWSVEVSEGYVHLAL